MSRSDRGKGRGSCFKCLVGTLYGQHSLESAADDTALINNKPFIHTKFDASVYMGERFKTTLERKNCVYNVMR